MNIVFHGRASTYSEGFADLLSVTHAISVLPDRLDKDRDRNIYAEADVVVGVRYDAQMPRSTRIRLLQSPGAGIDSIDLKSVPPQTTVCNCFGHEQAVAEYVMAALLQRHVPLADADRALRGGAWTYAAGARERAHDEIGGTILGILGFGHIGRAVAARAKAFGITVYVANRSLVGSADADEVFALSDLDRFWSSADTLLVSVPLTPETKGFVDARAFSRMKPSAFFINVARGEVVDENALFDVLSSRSISGAIIDAWYNYPSAANLRILPSALPFHELPNVVMTPHMSGWTNATIRRRQIAIAENIRRLACGLECRHIVRPAIRTR